jgi:hypothetical protein
VDTKLTGIQARKILEDAGVSRDEFAGIMGIKRSTMRTCLYGNRVSRKMVLKLKELAGEEIEKREIADVEEMIEQVVAPIKEVEKRVKGAEELIGRVYLKPRNPYRYDVEFADGSHGWFRAKPNSYFIGDEVRLRKADRGWEVVRCG